MYLTKQRFGAILAYTCFTFIAGLLACFLYHYIVPLFSPTGWLDITLGALVVGETACVIYISQGRGLHVFCYILSLFCTTVTVGLAAAFAGLSPTHPHVTHLLLWALGLGLLPLLAVCGLRLKEAK